MRLLQPLRTFVFAALVASGAMFSTTNATGTVLVIDSGWQADDIDAADTPSLASPWTFTLTGSAVFSITDAFVVGDNYIVTNMGGFLLTTALGLLPTPWTPGGGTPDNAWADPNYQHGQITLGPGDYSLSISGDGVGGLPAGFYIRLDTAAVPEPAMLALLGLGFIGIAFSRRRKPS